MTPYDALRQACGLSQREAADFHGIANLKTVQRWCVDGNSRHAARPRVLDELSDLYLRISRAAEEALEQIEAVESEEIVIGYPADDHEAQALGLPCVGAWRAMIGQVIALSDRPIALVPRGSTPETAGAADMNDRAALD